MKDNVKKRVLAGTLAAVFCLGVVGCSSNGSDQAQSDNAGQAAQDQGGPGGNRMDHRTGGFGRGVGSYTDNQELLSLLNLDAQKLEEQLKAGKSLADVAKEQGVDEEKVITLLVNQQEEKRKEAVNAGKLTQEQADKMKEGAHDQVKAQVENVNQGRGPGEGKGFGMDFTSNQELLSLLKQGAGKLEEQMKAGQSLAAIAEAQGVKKDDVIALLTKQQKERLDSQVEAGKLTREEADQRGKDIESRIQKMVEGTMKGR